MAKTDDAAWMSLAYAYALKAKAAEEIPVGAVLVNQDQEVLGFGWNQTVQRQDPTAHAEMIAICQAANKVHNHRLDNATLYVTLEPCCMCAGALIQARVKRLVFATRDFKAGAAGSVFNLLKGDPLNHTVQIDEGILQEESAQLLLDFFKSRRAKSAKP